MIQFEAVSSRLGQQELLLPGKETVQMKFGVFGVPFSFCIAVTLIPPASADPIFGPGTIGLTVNGMASAECGSTQMYNPPMFLFSLATQLGGSVTSSGVCTPQSASSVTSTSFARVNGVSGSVTITGTGFGSGAGEVNAGYFDIVNLQPPPGFSGSGVTFGMIANYDVDLATNSQTLQASAALSLSVPLFDQDAATPLFIPVGDGDHTFTGLLQTASMTFASCPCSAEFILEGGAAASGDDGTSASFSDPVSFVLPPGWTYTLASDASSTPEPGSLVLVVIGLAAVFLRAALRACWNVPFLRH
jgi:hypothetical protein